MREALILDREKIFSYTAGCFNGEPASCTYACPFHLDLRSFLKKAARGRWDAAYKELQSAVLFPALVAALCPHPCETACQRMTVLNGDPIAVGRLERACVAFSRKKEAAFFPVPPRTERVAVVGAGPAGLSCALALAQKRISVTVFDRNEAWGGSLRGDPRFFEFDEDFTRAFSVVEVAFCFGKEISSLAEVEGFDAVLLATGQGGADFGLLPGWDDILCATGTPGVFLAGECAGASLMEGMAQGIRAARSIEAFVQTGSAESAAMRREEEKCTRYAPHDAVPDAPGIRPAGEEYTQEEAKAEAGRCMLCDCDACMNSCELLTRYKKKPPRIGNDVFMDAQSRNSVSTASITRQTWSCNLCYRCGAKCAEGVDLRGLFQISRAGRVQSGNYPPALHDYRLREMAFSAGEGSVSARGSGAFVFFPGCRLGASNPAYVTRGAAYLSETLGAGVFVNCCGAPAYWAGDEEGLKKHLSALSEEWEALGKPTLVTACLTCDRMLAQLLPELPTVSLYEVLAERGAGLRALPFDRAAVFDPCAALGRDPVRQAVRRLAAEGGVSVTAYDSDGKCCGFGGHMRLANPGLYDEITKSRAGEAEEPYLVYCANCREVFASQGKPCAHILDAVFGLDSVGVPTLEEKRENSLSLKKELMETYRNEVFEPEVRPWDGLPVTLLPEVGEKMERLLITLGDVRETIWRAEEAGEGFQNAAGDQLCSRNGTAVIYWVRYRKDAGADGTPCYTVTDAYYHRMRPREEG